MDITENEAKGLLQVKSLPTIVLYHGGKQMLYEGKPTLEGLRAFLDEHGPSTEEENDEKLVVNDEL